MLGHYHQKLFLRPREPRLAVKNIFKKSLTRLQGRCQDAPDLLHFLATATCQFLGCNTVHGWLKLMSKAFLAASLCSVNSSELFWSRHAGHRPQSRDRSRFFVWDVYIFFIRWKLPFFHCIMSLSNLQHPQRSHISVFKNLNKNILNGSYLRVSEQRVIFLVEFASELPASA